MPDFRGLVSERISRLDLPPDRQQKIVDEWSAQLAEIYAGLRADGLTEDEAWRELQRELPASPALADDLLAREPLAVRVAERTRPPLPRESVTAAVRSIRQVLSAGNGPGLRA